MKLPLPLLAATVAFAFATPALVHAGDQQSDDSATQAQVEAPAAVPAEASARESDLPAVSAPAGEPTTAQEAEEEEVICRSIRLDMSSRRKTRVCRTEEGWRQLNQRR